MGEDALMIGSSAGPTELGRAFVVGCRRSGTTWTMMLVAQHPHVAALQQTDVVRRLYHFIGWFEQSHQYGRCILTHADEGAPSKNGLAKVSIPDVLSDERLYELGRPLVDEVFERAAQASPGTRMVVEQTPEHIHVAEPILRLYPDAYFVHVIRDPRSVFSSHRSAARGWAKPQFFSTDPVQVAREWCTEVRVGRRIAQLTERYLEIRYESLRANGEQELERIYDFLGLDSSPESIRAALASCSIDRLRQADYAPKGFFRKGEADGWRRELSSGELRTIEHLCGDLMRELDYPLVHPHPVPPTFRLRARKLRERLGDHLRTKASESDGMMGRTLSWGSRRSLMLRRMLAPRTRG